MSQGGDIEHCVRPRRRGKHELDASHNLALYSRAKEFIGRGVFEATVGRSARCCVRSVGSDPGRRGHQITRLDELPFLVSLLSSDLPSNHFVFGYCP